MLPWRKLLQPVTVPGFDPSRNACLEPCRVSSMGQSCRDLAQADLKTSPGQRFHGVQEGYHQVDGGVSTEVHGNKWNWGTDLGAGTVGQRVLLLCVMPALHMGALV